MASGSSSLPLQIAETVQTAHIQHAPSVEHDLNPSTAASAVEPVTLIPTTARHHHRHQHHHRRKVNDDDDEGIDDDEEDEDGEEEGEIDVDERQYSIVKRDARGTGSGEAARPTRTGLGPGSPLVRRRQQHLRHRVPLPDLRFEQSYLHSIAGAQGWWQVGWVTVRDQVMMPLAQGVLYNLLLCGWQYWNRNAQLHGNSAGARLRRWWYEVNHWEIPKEKKRR